MNCVIIQESTQREKSFSEISPDRGCAGAHKPKPARRAHPFHNRKVKMLFECAEAITEVCRMDLRIPAIKGRIFKRAKDLLLASVSPTPERIREIYGPGGEWYRKDWRGRKGDAPTPENILETWGFFTASIPDEREDRCKYLQYNQVAECYNTPSSKPL
jgi:hypothetical protein